MEYEQKARMAADRLLSYRDDQSGWQVCKKSVRFDLTSIWSVNTTHFKSIPVLLVYVFIRIFCLASLSEILIEFVVLL